MNIFLTQFRTEKLLIHKKQLRHNQQFFLFNILFIFGGGGSFFFLPGMVNKISLVVPFIDVTDPLADSNHVTDLSP